MPVPTLHVDNYFEGAASSIRTRIVRIPQNDSMAEHLSQETFRLVYSCLTGGVL